jgi:hypothetical protein
MVFVGLDMIHGGKAMKHRIEENEEGTSQKREEFAPAW